MKIRRVIRRRVRASGSGIDAAADVNVSLAANVGEARQRTTVSSRQRAASPDRHSTDDRANDDRNRARPDDQQEEVTDG